MVAASKHGKTSTRKPKSQPKAALQERPDPTNPLYQEGAEEARGYFASLVSDDPAEIVAPGPYLCDSEPELVEGYCDTLQALLVKALNERRAGGGKAAAGVREKTKGALTQKQIEYQIDQIATEMHSLKKIGTSIQCDTDSGCDYGLCVKAIAGHALRRADALLLSLGSIPVAHSTIDEEILEELKGDAEEAA